MVAPSVTSGLTEWRRPALLRAMAPESWTLEPPIRVEEGSTLCGRYQVAHMIGSGGMAAVYAGTHRNGHRVAIKMLHGRLSMNPEIDKRFRREAQLANQVNHPGAVPVLDDDVTEDGRSFLVMPLLEGETVRSWSDRRGGRLAIGEAISIVCAALDILTAAHAGGVVHCDIKPENIFLMRDGTVRVLDFGIARFFAASSPSATRTGMAVGTPAFMAPEQALGRFREISVQTDIWASGATLFTLLSGDFVHTGETPEELMAHAATKPARSLRDVAPDVPAEIREIVDRALAFQKGERWQSAAAMRTALLGAAQSISVVRSPLGGDAASGRWSVHSVATRSPVSVASAGSVEHGQPRLRRRRPTIAVASFVFVTAVVVATLSMHRSATSRDVRLVHDRADLSMASEQPVARAALESGIQLWKDASSETAREKFAEAARADPSLAVAHLLFAAASEWVDLDVRSHFSQARALRSHLTPEMAALFEALEPLFVEPPQLGLATERLAKLTLKAPDDTIPWMVRGAHDLRMKAPDRVSADLLHLHSAIGQWYRARADLLRDDVPSGRAALRSCAASSPQAVDCLESLTRLETNEGGCAAAAQAARSLIALDHTAASGYTFLANAELGLEHRTAAVRPILAEKWARLPDTTREMVRHRDEFFLAAYDGQFAAAFTELDAWEKAASSSADAAARGWPLLFRIDLEQELGDDLAAQKTARALADASQGWLRSEFFDATIEVTRALYLTGLLAREQFLLRRARDEDALTARAGYFAEPGVRWFDLYAQTIRDPEDARIALQHKPAGSYVVDAVFRDAGVDTEIGRTYLTADDPQSALEPLERAARSCSYVKPVQYIQGRLLLGNAFARLGRNVEACAAYAEVIHRWGGDRRSRSAREARVAADRLQCRLPNNEERRG